LQASFAGNFVMGQRYPKAGSKVGSINQI